MFKLIKLAFYVVIGYALYELYMGFKEGNPQMSDEAAAARISPAKEKEWKRPLEEPSGMSASHTVGRGVVS